MSNFYQQINAMNQQMEGLAKVGLNDDPKRRDHQILNKVISISEKINSIGASEELRDTLINTATAVSEKEPFLAGHLSELSNLMARALRQDQLLLKN
jgi:hypothetical protein